MKITKEEAIKIIEEAFETWKSEFGEGDWEKEDEALSMAISALEKENIYDDKEHYVTISKALYDKLNVDACEDTISREDARMSLTCEIKESMTITDYISMVDKRLRNLPSVQPKPIGCDAISREAFITRYREWMKSEYGKIPDDDTLAIRVIKSLPSVQPSHKGYWLHKEITDDYRVIGQCSECKHRKIIDNFCPNCGADMRESEVSE